MVPIGASAEIQDAEAAVTAGRNIERRQYFILRLRSCRRECQAGSHEVLDSLIRQRRQQIDVQNGIHGKIAVASQGNGSVRNGVLNFVEVIAGGTQADVLTGEGGRWRECAEIGRDLI